MRVEEMITNDNSLLFANRFTLFPDKENRSRSLTFSSPFFIMDFVEHSIEGEIKQAN